MCELLIGRLWHHSTITRWNGARDSFRARSFTTENVWDSRYRYFSFAIALFVYFLGAVQRVRYCERNAKKLQCNGVCPYLCVWTNKAENMFERVFCARRTILICRALASWVCFFGRTNVLVFFSCIQTQSGQNKNWCMRVSELERTKEIRICTTIQRFVAQSAVCVKWRAYRIWIVGGSVCWCDIGYWNRLRKWKSKTKHDSSVQFLF